MQDLLAVQFGIKSSSAIIAKNIILFGILFAHQLTVQPEHVNIDLIDGALLSTKIAKLCN